MIWDQYRIKESGDSFQIEQYHPLGGWHKIHSCGRDYLRAQRNYDRLVREHEAFWTSCKFAVAICRPGSDWESVLGFRTLADAKSYARYVVQLVGDRAIDVGVLRISSDGKLGNCRWRHIGIIPSGHGLPSAAFAAFDGAFNRNADNF